jgi:phenylalanyl-tRNA synthetase beta chain
MRISLNWLRELISLPLPPNVLSETLTLAGFEVEDIEDRRTWADGVVVGYVLERQPHPNADKLSVCQVDIGQGEPQQIVCGATNVAAQMFVPVATVGTVLPQINLKIKPAKLRGVASNGMICSLAELGLAPTSEGIHSFDPAQYSTLQPGQDVRPLLGLDDVVLDLTSTANRADALSMVGIAREVAALTTELLRLPQAPAVQTVGSGEPVAIGQVDPTACPAYIATVIAGVRIGPSPLWLQQRLQSAGVRPINNVVDVTNYIMLEWGQPLHAFDRDKLQAVAGTVPLTIGVRFGKVGEQLVTLDSQTRTATEQTLLITAHDHPVALAGVMGGEATEVDANTQNLLLEAALFDSAVIRRSARTQGLRTEASARYERGVNLAELEVACHRAVQLITQLAGGQVTAHLVQDARPATLTRTIELRYDRVIQVLGPVRRQDEIGNLTPAEVERTLQALNCQLQFQPAAAATSESPVWEVTVPPYRYGDLLREIDLIEEVARLYGYDNFIDTLPEQGELGGLSLEQMLLRKVRASLRAGGLTELIHYSLGKPGQDRQIVLSNPLFTEYSSLRTNLIDSLIEAFQYNLEQGNGALNGFEVGRIFWQEEFGLSEVECVAGILGGDIRRGKWPTSGRDHPLSWFEAKGLLQSSFEQLGLVVEYQPDRRDPRLHPGRTASLWIGGDRLGSFGQLHPQLCQERGLPNQVYVFELDLDVLLKHLATGDALVPQFRPYSSYPAADRDIAFYINTQVSVAELERVITQAGGSLLETVDLFDQYVGDRVPAGQRSLAFRLIYRADDRTLSDTEIEPVHQKVRDTLVEKFQVELRS